MTYDETTLTAGVEAEMCGIVGLHLRGTEHEEQLGALLGHMLSCMASRGPDSAGAAIYSQPSGATKLSLLAPTPQSWTAIAARLAAELGAHIEVQDRGDVGILTSGLEAEPIVDALRLLAPELLVIGSGSSVEVYKRVGHADQVTRAYGLDQRGGFQGIGHTRMATESAVTTAHSHPFAPGGDVALVHNGSFSNYATVRGRLRTAGVRFDTDNDSEVAARLVARQLSLGDDLTGALDTLAAQLDGFYTLLVTTATEFAIVRDAFACKPAVIAETESYVAVASEYHALASLPGIADADVYEPTPDTVYVWKR